jgi:hypothetical protein
MNSSALVWQVHYFVPALRPRYRQSALLSLDAAIAACHRFASHGLRAWVANSVTGERTVENELEEQFQAANWPHPRPDGDADETDEPEDVDDDDIRLSPVVFSLDPLPNAAPSVQPLVALANPPSAPSAYASEAPSYFSYPDFKSKAYAEGRPVSGRISFDYTNADGEATTRTASVDTYLQTMHDLYIVAHCELRREVRTFRVSRIHRAIDTDSGHPISNLSQWLAARPTDSPEQLQAKAASRKPCSELSPAIPVAIAQSVAALSDLSKNNLVELEALGWVTLFNGAQASLHRRFKNGKTHKTPTVSIAFIEFDHDLLLDGDRVMEANHRRRREPWEVCAKGLTAKTFRDLSSAAECFLKLAQNSAPNRKTVAGPSVEPKSTASRR